jgi:hypothetical protein
MNSAEQQRSAEGILSLLSQYILISWQYRALPDLVEALMTLNCVGRRACPVRWHRRHGKLFRDCNECLQPPVPASVPANL